MEGPFAFLCLLMCEDQYNIPVSGAHLASLHPKVLWLMIPFASVRMCFVTAVGKQIKEK